MVGVFSTFTRTNYGTRKGRMTMSDKALITEATNGQRKSLRRLAEDAIDGAIDNGVVEGRTRIQRLLGSGDEFKEEVVDLMFELSSRPGDNSCFRPGLRMAEIPDLSTQFETEDNFSAAFMASVGLKLVLGPSFVKQFVGMVVPPRRGYIYRVRRLNHSTALGFYDVGTILEEIDYPRIPVVMDLAALHYLILCKRRVNNGGLQSTNSANLFFVFDKDNVLHAVDVHLTNRECQIFSTPIPNRQHFYSGIPVFCRSEYMAL